MTRVAAHAGRSRTSVAAMVPEGRSADMGGAYFRCGMSTRRLHLAVPTTARHDGQVRAVRAKVAHEIPDRAPLQLAVGDSVAVGPRDTEWPEFVFVTSSRGAGWVPARHLSAASGTATVIAPYDTTELPTQVNDILEVLAEDLVSGWLWCRSRDGREGWIPLNTVDTLD